MDKYRLAKLVEWAGTNGLDGRKRLQKVIFFLQKSGCDFGADFTLHHYGPYSRDVAEACDQLVKAGILQEEVSSNARGHQYTYKVSPGSGETAIRHTETKLSGEAAMSNHKSFAEDLLKEQLWDLELGSTILYFRYSSNDWNEACRLACDFKSRDQQSEPSLPKARALAERAFSSSGN